MQKAEERKSCVVADVAVVGEYAAFAVDDASAALAVDSYDVAFLQCFLAHENFVVGNQVQMAGAQIYLLGDDQVVAVDVDVAVDVAVALYKVVDDQF